MKLLVFDTETTGLPKKGQGLADKTYPHIVQLCFYTQDLANPESKGTEYDYIIKPAGWDIPPEASAIHGITSEQANKDGHPLKQILHKFAAFTSRADLIVGHNIGFDSNIVQSSVIRYVNSLPKADLISNKGFCTMLTLTEHMKLPGKYGDYKWPRLSEAYEFLFKQPMVNAHNALYDVRATVEIFKALPEELLLKHGLNSKQVSLIKQKEKTNG